MSDATLYENIKGRYTTKRILKLLLDTGVTFGASSWANSTFKVPPFFKKYHVTEILAYPAIQYITSALIPDEF